MCFFFSFVPATIWIVIGYFVLFSSTRADGALGAAGRAIATWAFLLAGAIVAVGAYVTLNEICPLAALMTHTR